MVLNAGFKGLSYTDTNQAKIWKILYKIYLNINKNINCCICKKSYNHKIKHFICINMIYYFTIYKTMNYSFKVIKKYISFTQIWYGKFNKYLSKVR